MDEDEVVYSTDSGDRRKPVKGKGSQPELLPAGIKNDGIVRIQRESKGRGGKTVTVVYGLPLTDGDLKDYAKKMKQKCGVGGSVDGRVIVIQGDKVTMLMEILQQDGYVVKKVGG